MKLHDAGRWYVAWCGSNMKLPSPNAQPTKETRYYISSLDFNEASAINICTFVSIK